MGIVLGQKKSKDSYPIYYIKYKNWVVLNSLHSNWKMILGIFFQSTNLYTSIFGYPIYVQIIQLFDFLWTQNMPLVIGRIIKWMIQEFYTIILDKLGLEKFSCRLVVQVSR